MLVLLIKLPGTSPFVFITIFLFKNYWVGIAVTCFQYTEKGTFIVNTLIIVKRKVAIFY
jgi:hypothetical protein